LGGWYQWEENNVGENSTMIDCKNFENVTMYPQYNNMIIKIKNNNKTKSHTPVAHTCNPSNSGGRDREDHGLKLTWANSF
jgi:hypothetical protein